MNETGLNDQQKAILAKLREKFPPEALEKKPKLNCKACSDSKTKNCEKHQKTKCRTCKAYISTQHIHLDYVGHARVTDRLLENDPLWNWEPMARHADGTPVLDDNGGMWINLTIGGVTRIGYGHADGKRGGDAVKETIGDAIRNAALRFGVALELWMKEGAPEPATTAQSDEPEETVTAEQVVNGLRNKCLSIWRGKGGDVASLVAEYARWSSNPKDQDGRDMAKETDPALLREFEKYLCTDRAKP